MSFSGLKTAVLTLVRKHEADGTLDARAKANIAAEFEQAAVDVLAAKAIAALDATAATRLVVAGGVGANRNLRERLKREVARRGAEVYYPDLAFCTDNGAMIALAGAMRLRQARVDDGTFTVRPRWELASLPAA
jgi:N6-L-threonylcarbamoyladenine synthase